MSRKNSYKHGLAGNGVVLSPTDAAEVARRSAAMQTEMRPTCEMGSYLIDRLARLTVRVERCAQTEDAAVEYLAVHAHAAFDEARIGDVDRAMDWLRAEPMTNARKLRSMPEGVDRLIAALLDLRKELEEGRWGWLDGEKMANIQGSRWLEVPTTRVRALSEAAEGNFVFLSAGDGAGLGHDRRVAWARDTMAELIDTEVEALLAHRETLDLEAIEFDRATAPVRARFDPSKTAVLARRYEAAAERGVYKALAEFRRVEAEAAERGPVEAPPAEQEPAVEEELASSGKKSRGPFLPPPPEAPTGPIGHYPTLQRANPGPNPVGTAGRGPA